MASKNGNGTWLWPDNSEVKRVNIALQGGGSHGAFSWGVLDRLLEEPRFAIEAISGTSAGAVNAAVLAEGLAEGGPDMARRRLEEFWSAISREARTNPIQRTPIDIWLSNWSLDANPALAMFEMMSRVVSPYQFNPLNLNPLMELIEREIDFDKVRACQCIELYISATNVHTGRAKVFNNADLSAKAIMASACLPFIFQAVVIDDVPYWDGGFMGNPVLFPFYDASRSTDILIIQVNPIERTETPQTAREIVDRVNEIAFNAPLVKELRHINFINQAVRRGDLTQTGFREMYLHRIGGGNEITQFPASTKLNAEWAFLLKLRDAGRAAAETWLQKNFAQIGRESTINLSHLHETAAASPLSRPEDSRKELLN